MLAIFQRAGHLRLAGIGPSNSARRQPTSSSSSTLLFNWSATREPAFHLRLQRLREYPITFPGDRGEPHTGFDEKASSGTFDNITMNYIDKLRRTWHSLSHIRPYARPGWWTLKRWVEFIWFRKQGA